MYVKKLACARPGGHPSVGAMHSEEPRAVGTVFHKKHSIRHAHTDEECVALFGGGLLPEGEAFPDVAPYGSLSC